MNLPEEYSWVTNKEGWITIFLEGTNASTESSKKGKVSKKRRALVWFYFSSCIVIRVGSDCLLEGPPNFSFPCML